MTTVTTDFGPPSNPQFAPAPEGWHDCVVVDVVDQGVQDTKYGAKAKLMVIWETEAVNGDTGERYQIRQYANNAFTSEPRSNMYKIVSKMMGRQPTDEEMTDVKWKSFLVGMNCIIEVEHKLTEKKRIRAAIRIDEDKVWQIKPNSEGAMEPKDYKPANESAESEGRKDDYNPFD